MTTFVSNEGREDYPVIFGQLTKKDGSFLVGRNKIDNFNWKMLENSEIIGGRRGGVPAMTLEYALKQNKLIDTQNITINYGVQFDMIIPSFESGVGDYCTMFEPAASNYVNAGKGYILASVGEMAGDMPFTAFSATSSYLNDNSVQAAAFMRAIVKGMNYLAEHTAMEVAKLINPSFIDTNVEMLAKSIQSYIDIGAYCSDPIMKKADFEHLQDVIIDTGVMTKRADYDKLVNNKYAESAIAV